MKKYAKVINEETKLCEVGLGINNNFYASIGMEEMEVEQDYAGNWYLAGYAPAKPEEVLAEEKRADRDRLLNDSDKRMLPDFPVSAEEKEQWLLYREYLRDITKDPAFPNVDVLNFANWLGQIHSKEPVLGA
jgi:hypothetical protein